MLQFFLASESIDVFIYTSGFFCSRKTCPTNRFQSWNWFFYPEVVVNTLKKMTECIKRFVLFFYKILWFKNSKISFKVAVAHQKTLGQWYVFLHSAVRTLWADQETVRGLRFAIKTDSQSSCHWVPTRERVLIFHWKLSPKLWFAPLIKIQYKTLHSHTLKSLLKTNL